MVTLTVAKTIWSIKQGQKTHFKTFSDYYLLKQNKKPKTLSKLRIWENFHNLMTGIYQDHIVDVMLIGKLLEIFS